jgi:hypothetical protein
MERPSILFFDAAEFQDSFNGAIDGINTRGRSKNK